MPPPFRGGQEREHGYSSRGTHMSDLTSSLELASPGEFGAETVNADAVDSILADFRAWLLEAGELAPIEPVPSLDVATVVQHFIALRQEVNLQTKATRAQQEQGAEAIGLLQEALGTIESLTPDD